MQPESEDMKMQRKAELQLYLYLERLLGKKYLHYSKQSKYYKRQVSKQDVVNETIKYLTYLKENIKQFPSQHNQQLLFLIDIWKNLDQMITNNYRLHNYYKDPTGQTLFMLSFCWKTTKIDVKKFSSFSNWNHLGIITFANVRWFNDDDWRALVENSGNFSNLKALWFHWNKISVIKEGDIEKFKSLEEIDLKFNPLSEQSKEVLKKLRQKNNKMTIDFSE